MRVRALDDFYYDHDRKRGEVFDIPDPTHVSLLAMNQKIALVVEEPQQQNKRRDYRRRDMRADE